MHDRRHFLKLSAGLASATAVATVVPAWAGNDGRTGRFSGRSNHVTTGKAELTTASVVLFNDFSLDGAPDARVGLGRNGKYDAKTDLGALKNLKGKQSYRLRKGIDVSNYNEIYIWCRKFNVPLGVAKLGN